MNEEIENEIMRRQFPGDIPRSEAKELLELLVSYLSLKWIKRAHHNPIQILWNRRDVFATIELLTLGYYLRLLRNENDKWVKHQIQHIKGDNRNNRAGALFEICALGMFFNEGQTVKASHKNQPGIDGTVIISEKNRELNVSIKNYGKSTAQIEFETNCSTFESRIKQLIKEMEILGIQLYIEFTAFPGKQQWDSLNNSLRGLLVESKKKGVGLWAVPDICGVMIAPLKGMAELDPSLNSYSLIVTSPYHRNEENNLFSKLDDACYNLAKYSKETKDRINSIFLRLPATASISACRDNISSYFKQYPDKEISVAFLYQPTITSINENSSLHHCFNIISNSDKFSRWGVRNLQVATPIGLVSEVPAKNNIVIETADHKQVIELDKKYLYQRGNIYLKQVQTDEGTITGNMSKHAPGVISHAVLQILPNASKIILSGRFSPDDELLIL